MSILSVLTSPTAEFTHSEPVACRVNRGQLSPRHGVATLTKVNALDIESTKGLATPENPSALLDELRKRVLDVCS